MYDANTVSDVINIIIKNSGEYKNEIYSYYNRHKCRLIYQLIKIDEYIEKINNDIKILEIGPYPGVISGYLSQIGYNVDVLEYPRPEMKYLNNIYKKLGINNIIYHNLASEKDIPTDTKYNIILMFEVIEHIPSHPLFVMNKINKILLEDGLLFLSTPNLLSSYNRVAIMRGKNAFPIYDFDLETTKGHFREYSKDELIYILNKSNFKIIYIKNYDKKDYCRLSGMKYKNTIEDIKVMVSRLFFKIIGNKSDLKKFYFIISKKSYNS